MDTKICRLHDLPPEIILLLCDYLCYFDVWTLSKVVRGIIPAKWFYISAVCAARIYDEMPPLISHVSGSFLYSPTTEKTFCQLKNRETKQIKICDTDAQLMYAHCGYLYKFGGSLQKCDSVKILKEISPPHGSYHVGFSGNMIVLQYIREMKIFFIDHESLNIVHTFYVYYMTKKNCYTLVEDILYCITGREELRKFGVDMPIDNFYNYGGVNCITSHNGRIFIGLKSGNVNIYKDDKFVSYFIADGIGQDEIYSGYSSDDDDEPECVGDQTEGVYCIRYYGKFLYTSGERSIKRWVEGEDGIFRRFYMTVLNTIPNYKIGSVRNLEFDFRGSASCDVFPAEEI